MTQPATIDKYQIIKPLGHGHFGQVYHAFDRALNAEKAIKILNTTDPSTFMESLREAQTLNKLTHKHIVTINEANIFNVDGQQRVVLDLEYIPQGSLESALSSRWLSIREAVSYLRGALIGLEHAHSQGFLHRDIKPGNILLAPNAPKLSDFGLATQPSASYGSDRGYITHLPPEFFSARSTSVRTDVFAAGVTLFRTLSNISSWGSILSATPNVRQHVERGTLIQRVGFQEFIPQPVIRIVRKACHRDANNRYQSATLMRQQLDRLRFSIDWIKQSEFEWSGADGKHEYFATTNAGNDLTVKRNGRRINQLCGAFPTSTEALSALHRHIADTTLA